MPTPATKKRSAARGNTSSTCRCSRPATDGEDRVNQIRRSQEYIEDVLASGERVYGVNTGFGQLAQVRISDDDLGQLQENLIRSHAVGVGALLPGRVVRLTMVM